MDRWRDSEKRVEKNAEVSAKFKLLIPAVTRARIEAIVAAAPDEILWFGLVDSQGDEHTVTEIYVPRHKTAHASFSEAFTQAMPLYMERLTAQGREAEIPNIRYWGHSHGNMGVFFSGIDRSTMELHVRPISKELQAPCAKTLFSTVHNKQGEMTAWASLFVEGFGVMHLDVTKNVQTMLDPRLFAWAKREVVRKLPKKTKLPFGSLFERTSHKPLDAREILGSNVDPCRDQHREVVEFTDRDGKRVRVPAYILGEDRYSG